MYECKLVKDGYIQELFYRESSSIEEMHDYLNYFQWPKGEWTVTDTEDLDD